MKRLLSFGVLAAFAFIAGCGGTDNSITDPGGSVDPGVQTAATVELLVSTPNLDSDQTNTNSVTITATIKDANNVVVADVPVAFAADMNASITVDVSLSESPRARLRIARTRSTISRGLNGLTT